MYTREELKLLKRDFWEGFSDYCKALPHLKDRKRTWMLYNTKVKGVELKFDLSRQGVAVVLEVNSKPVSKRKEMYEKLGWYKADLEKDIPDALIWEEDYQRESGEVVSRLYTMIYNLDFHRRQDWMALYQFMESRMYILEKNLLSISEYLREE